MPFKDHFSGHSSAYAAARPSYPGELFAWLAAQCREHALAWDAGCGNGQAAVALAAHFARVHATDPSAAQIAAATAHPKVEYRTEAAEDCSLPDACADLVTVAQALHWFDLTRFYPQVRRVLKPGGVIAAWTYGLSSVSPGVDAVFHKLYEDRLGPYWPADRHHVETGYRDLPFPFAPLPAPPAFEMVCLWTLRQYLAYLRTWSASQRHLQATGFDAVDAVAADMAEAWGDPQQRRPVRWPLAIRAGRVG
ncbi:MAG: class I SAM-dependent methyltransferase [Rehaibacterium terrae]|uniref:class I SAM-dependent methyltransferase n=1 Tax=Rehaibacterium terrae TaxID=1341696 RepID=UPI00391C8B18